MEEVVTTKDKTEEGKQDKQVKKMRVRITVQGTEKSEAQEW